MCGRGMRFGGPHPACRSLPIQLRCGTNFVISYGDAVQRPWTLACHARDRGFESPRPRQYRCRTGCSFNGLGYLAVYQKTRVRLPHIPPQFAMGARSFGEPRVTGFHPQSCVPRTTTGSPHAVEGSTPSASTRSDSPERRVHHGGVAQR